MTEIWKDVINYEGFYQVSTFGKVRSLDRMVNCRAGSRLHRGKVLVPYAHKEGGYLFVILSREGVGSIVSVHRLVAETFIANPQNKPQVNHKDGNRQNNSIDNLEWVTRSENMRHAMDTGLWNPKLCGEIARQSCGTNVKCLNDDTIYSSIQQAALAYDISWDCVKMSLLYNKPFGGYKFSEVTD